MQSRVNFRLALLVPLVVLVFAACTPKTHEERVADIRSYYKARLIGFIVQAQPVPEAPAEEPMEGAADEMASTETEGDTPGGVDSGEMEAEEEITPIRQNVSVDILLQHDSPEKLPGITLDIEMVDAKQLTKNTWKIWVETAKLPKATGTQFTHLLEDVEYVEGDGFSVEVRSPVPPEERAEYREFSPPAGS